MSCCACDEKLKTMLEVICPHTKLLQEFCLVKSEKYNMLKAQKQVSVKLWVEYRLKKVELNESPANDTTLRQIYRPNQIRH